MNELFFTSLFSILSLIGEVDSFTVSTHYKYDNLNELYFDVNDSNVFIASYIQKNISTVNVNTLQVRKFDCVSALSSKLFTPRFINVCEDTIYIGKDRLVVGYDFNGRRIAQYEIKVREDDQYVPNYPDFLEYPMFRKFSGSGIIAFPVMPYYYPGESPDENTFFNLDYYIKKKLIGLVDLNMSQKDKTSPYSSNIEFIRTLAHFDKVYVDSALLFHYTTRFWDIDDKQKYIIVSQMATHKIVVYDLNGNELHQYGVMGQSVDANNKLTRFTAEDYTLHRRDRSEYVRARSLINTNYFHLFYDEQTNTTIRIYKNAVPGLTESDVSFDKIDTMNSNRINELFINRPTFIQIYKGYKLSKEVPFPPDLKIIAFEKNVVWTVKKEEERLTFYKVTLN